jgi:AraC-like DNA-binding protein
MGDKADVLVHCGAMGHLRTIISTDAVPLSHRRPYWRDLVCNTFVDLACEIDRPETFHGRIEKWQGASLAYSTVKANAHHVSRDRERIARSTDDHFLLSLQISGTGLLGQDGRHAILHPGDFAIYDVTRPYRLLFDDEFEQLVMQIPRAQIARRLFDAENLTAVSVDGQQGAGRLASTLIAQTASQLAALDARSLEQAQSCVLDLAANALAASTGQRSEIVSESQELTVRRILHYIDERLGDPALTCELVARENGISERYLRKLFQNKGHGVAEWIWSRRLEKAREDLRNPRLAHRSITSVAYDWGFKDTGHFSRAFKTRFGETPREARAGAARS